MKILFLTPQLPYPPQQGTQIRNFHLLRAAASAHRVDLLSFAREGETLDRAAPLRDLCGEVTLLPVPAPRTPGARMRTLVTSPEPDMARRLRSAALAASLRSLAAANRYDLIHVAGLEMAPYIPVAKATGPGALIVFDDHNAEHLLQARAAAVDARNPLAWPRASYSLIQWLKLRRYEAEVCRAADGVIAVSEADAAALRPLSHPTPVSVVPNGVDVAYYHSQPAAGRDPAGVLFTGTMDYRPNVDAVGWFASAILPVVAARRPDVLFRIVGRSPGRSVRRLAERHRNVTVTGAVDDVRPYFARSSVFVVPIRMAGGARLKILEALAMGLPIVSTHVGAEGIELADGEEVLLADTPADLASAILRLLEDPDLRARMAVAGRRAAAERFDWSRVAPRLLEAYRFAATGRQGDGETGRAD